MLRSTLGAAAPEGRAAAPPVAGEVPWLRAYAQLLLDMQKRVHDHVVADKGTAKQALDALVVDWKKVFKEDGKVK